MLAWLTGRSVARGLPAPVLDRGGYRVDTNGVAEVKRWVFPRVCDGLVGLANAIDAPGHVLKACVTNAELAVALPDRWTVHAPTYFMMATGPSAASTRASGYTIDVDRTGAVIEIKVRDDTGEVAASGFGGETPDAFVYDRIETAVVHRRRGLGRMVMTALNDARHDRTTPALLVATDDGRALYSTLGWETISPYATASIVVG